ncbi:hypothetical protein PENSTE_c006G00682 [Penicillium steckii]|uniref:Uncharacterized protein n=1 Tax=Penicillium steckii TaxID=303698 RepID=A0A1V6TI64_9EURO|nr:hypothetical protein PENSTE_c006G00682 [Penicillium steckii]
MDVPRMPFSNLDVCCKWSGDPHQDVEVEITVDIWCCPGTHLTVFDTRHPSTCSVKSFTLNPKIESSDGSTPKASKASSASAAPTESPIPTLSPPASASKSAPVTPARKSSDRGVSRSASSLPDAETPSNCSDTESIIVLNNLHQDGFLGEDILPDPFCADLSLNASPAQSQERSPDQLNKNNDGQLPSSPLLPRKRSAKAASLPDSVTDSERGYGGFKTVASPISPSTSSTNGSRSCQRSLIPRPRPKTLDPEDKSQSVPSKASLPEHPNPAIETDVRRLENNISPLFKDRSKENIVRRAVRRKRMGSNIIPSLVTPSKSSSPQDSQNQADLEKVSTVAVTGSPCDFAGLMAESGKTSPTDSSRESKGAIIAQSQYICPSDDLVVDDYTKPLLYFTGGKLYISSPNNVEASTYVANITLSVPLQEGRPGWYELVVPGLPRLAPQEHGYVFFFVPLGYGMEFRTLHLRRYSLVEGCLMAQMLISNRIVIPLRVCDSNFFGYLKDFNVVQAIRADIVQTPEDEADEHFRLVRYRATCSVKLVQADFWADRCGFWLYIHGGPDDEFFCPMQSGSFQEIHLDSSAGRVGVTKVEVLCGRSNLEKFAITWEVKQVKDSPIWMPRIRASCSYELEDELEDELRGEIIMRKDRGLLVSSSPGVGATNLAVTSDPPDNTAQPSQQPEKQSVEFQRECKRYALLLLGVFLVVFIFRLYWRVLGNLCLEKQVPDEWCRESDPVVQLSPGLDKLVIHFEGEDILEQPEQEEVDYVQLKVNEEAVSYEKMDGENGSDHGYVPLRDRLDYLLGWRGPVGEL